MPLKCTKSSPAADASLGEPLAGGGTDGGVGSRRAPPAGGGVRRRGAASRDARRGQAQEPRDDGGAGRLSERHARRTHVGSSAVRPKVDYPTAGGTPATRTPRPRVRSPHRRARTPRGSVGRQAEPEATIGGPGRWARCATENAPAATRTAHAVSRQAGPVT